MPKGISFLTAGSAFRETYRSYEPFLLLIAREKELNVIKSRENDPYGPYNFRSSINEIEMHREALQKVE